MRMFAEHPFGVGYRNYPYMSKFYLSAEWLNLEGHRSAHNGFLNILTETGFVGFITWTSGFLGAVVVLNKLRKSRDATGKGAGGSLIPVYAYGMQLGLCGWFVCNLTQADHEVDPAYWFVALAVVMTRLYAMRLREMNRAAAETAPVIAGNTARLPVAIPERALLRCFSAR